MKINNIKAVNFRNFSNIDIDINNNIIFIKAKNGIGKSNLLELISYNFMLKSYRHQTDNKLIKKNENFYSIKINYTLNENNYDRKLIYTKNKKQIITEPDNDLIKLFLPVLYTKNSMFFIFQLEYRRKIIDGYLSLVDNDYKMNLKLYNNYLKDKKKIIYNTKIPYNQKINLIEILNNSIYKAVFYIIKKRSSFSDSINLYFNSNNLKYSINHHSDYKNYSEDELEHVLNNSIEKEIKYEKYYGIHKDKFNLLNNNLSIELNSSFADFKLYVFYFYLFCYKKYTEKENIYPPFLIDDYLSEIDNNNCEILINNLLNITKGESDIFISLIEEEKRFNNLIKDSQIINLENL